MPEYRRLRVPGGTYFFTVNLRVRGSRLLLDHIDALRQAVATVRQRQPFHIDAWVVLPDHMHCIWTLPDGDVAYPNRWYAIKARFSRSIPPTEHRSTAMRARGERGLWQRRYWEHAIRDDSDYANHMDYVHFNPVKHGLAATPSDWPHSTFNHCVRIGLYPNDWCGPAHPTPATPASP